MLLKCLVPTALLLLVGMICVHPGTCKVRKYYLAAQDIIWSYADSQKNLVNSNQQRYADTYLRQSNNRIGRSYKKTTYFEYTDDTFTSQIPKPAYLGLLGPTIRGEIGDVIDIVYFNNASGTYSIHPHGLFYLKQHEGALYLDGTSGRYKSDEIVKPGQTIRLIWNVTERDAPGEDDPNCLPWVYHSHVNTGRDTSAGLVGALITCKKGILNDQNERTDVDLDVPILMKIYDENLSWHLKTNLNRCLDPASCRQLHQDEDEDFIESNYMHSLNGRMFGHLHGLGACVGDKVAFYVIGMGNEFDIHSLHFQGQTLNYQHSRGDTVSVYTATFVAAETVPTSAGTWILSDMVDGMARAGMSAFYNTKYCQNDSAPSSDEQSVRFKEYFLSAEEIDWDYGPGGRDLYRNEDLTTNSQYIDSARFFEKSESRIGGKYIKAKFFQYTDGEYKTKVNRSSHQSHMGILGPLIEAEVGEAVKVTLKNSLPFPISFLPHGLTFDFRDEIGNVATGVNNTRGIIPPNSKYTYTFHVPPTIMDGTTEQCRNFIYTSGVEPTRHHNSGLVGPILVCKKCPPQRQQTDLDKRFFLLLSMFDENESMFREANINRHLSGDGAKIDKNDEDFKASNQIFAINGLAFATIPGLTVCVGSNVTWYVMSVGGTEDVYSLGFDGNIFQTKGKNRNIHNLVSGSTAVLEMKPDNEGTWLVYTATREANVHGTYGLYHVQSCGRPETPEDDFTRTRELYVAAEEVDWDYAPMERGLITGMDLNDPRGNGNVFVKDDEYFIGDEYRKVIYKEYVDHTFTEEKTRELSDRHMDIIGPAIRAEVNERITIHFKNKASRPYSIHPNGLKYTHRHSGKTYGRYKAEVPPGHSRTYSWLVPARSGPGPSDPDCIPWLYHSGVNPGIDSISGLIGPIIICRAGTLDRNGRRKDKTPEFFILMSIFDENLSWYFQENIKRHAPHRVGTDYESDGEFEESNIIHAVNGRIYGNNPDLVMEHDKNVTWYFMVSGSKLDIHTIHTHGHTFVHTSDGHRDDVVSMFPGMAEAVKMHTDNPGTWLLHCHTLDHIAAGMETTYTVLKPGIMIPEEGSLSNTMIG